MFINDMYSKLLKLREYIQQILPKIKQIFWYSLRILQATQQPDRWRRWKFLHYISEVQTKTQTNYTILMGIFNAKLEVKQNPTGNVAVEQKTH